MALTVMIQTSLLSYYSYINNAIPLKAICLIFYRVLTIYTLSLNCAIHFTDYKDVSREQC